MYINIYMCVYTYNYPCNRIDASPSQPLPKSLICPLCPTQKRQRAMFRVAKHSNSHRSPLCTGIPNACYLQWGYERKKKKKRKKGVEKREFHVK